MGCENSCSSCFCAFSVDEPSRDQRPRAYLAGAMEKAGEYARTWRAEITPHLEALGYRVFNPCLEEMKVGIDVPSLLQVKNTDFLAYKRWMEQIVDYDLAALESCDLVVCLLDYAVLSGAGTYGELTLARRLGMPVYAWVDLPRGAYDLPGWALGCLTTYHETKEEFYAAIPAAPSTDVIEVSNCVPYNP